MKTNTKTVNKRVVKTRAKFLALAEFVGMSEKEIREHIVRNYEISEDVLNKYNLLIVHEEQDGYEGYSHLLLEDKVSGNLYANYASHCSCFGF